MENPKRDTAVMAVLIAVTLPAPNLSVIRSLIRLETTVPKAITIYTIPAYDNGTENSVYMVGHAAPSIESGRPRLINARYITASRR